MTNSQVVAHSLSPQGEELISILATFPRSILAEVNTHRMLSKNTSSSRAIPFPKMLEAIENNPFVPIAWQKEHKGMQGNKYITNIFAIKYLEKLWLEGRDNAVAKAKELGGIHGIALEHLTDFEVEETIGITKQIVNRMLEPYMWTTMLITGSRSGWDNFFNLRCPQYEYIGEGDMEIFRSQKDFLKFEEREDPAMWTHRQYFNQRQWLEINAGQAEIHMMDLAEKIWDSVNESTPKQLGAGQWHIPFRDSIYSSIFIKQENNGFQLNPLFTEDMIDAVKISTAMSARTSYTVVGEEKGINYENMIGLHDRLLAQQPPHSSPLEHCARAMDNDEYYTFIKGKGETADNVNITFETDSAGWCNNLKGFIPYRYIIDNSLSL